VIGVAVALFALAVAAAAMLARLRLEAAALPREPARVPALVDEWHERWRGRTLVHVALRGIAVGVVRFVVSLPDPLPRARLPLVVVLGGVHAGSRTLREIDDAGGDPGPNAIAAFEWPFPQHDPGLADVILRLGTFRRHALAVPGQVDALIGWASGQPWADPERVSLLGFSLGAFVAPAAQRLVQERGVASIRATVLAYAGAPIGAVIAEHPAMRRFPLRGALGAAADLLLRPVEPSLHLPNLRGRFLLLGAESDRLIESRAAERLRALTPEPRTVVLIEGDHMGVGPQKLRLLETVVVTSRSWLVEQGAFDPPARGAARRSGPGTGRHGWGPRRCGGATRSIRRVCARRA
jgi:dienelactone hydrolase